MSPATPDPPGHRRRSDDLQAHLLASSRGDVQAFAQVYDAVAPRVFGLASRILRDPHQAEEVTQEVMLQLWSSSGDFDPARGSAIAWVMTLAHRRAVDRVRSSDAHRRRDAVHARESHQDPVDETATAAHASMEAQMVRTALAELSPPQREAIELAYFGGHTHTEVARLLQVPLGTAKSRIRDGLLRLRDTLPTNAVELA